MITLTDTATAKVADLLAQENEAGLALRIGVRPGGCSGFSYDMFFDSNISPEDSQVTFGEVSVIVDAQSAKLLDGAELDYKDGLTEAGFSISNPNAERTCGCGQSFS